MGSQKGGCCQEPQARAHCLELPGQLSFPCLCAPPPPRHRWGGSRLVSVNQLEPNDQVVVKSQKYRS